MILEALYLMLPAYFANMAPVFFKKVNFLNYPVDFGKKIKGKRILGSHKTFRGFFFGIILAIIVAYVQSLISAEVALVDYSNWALIGFLLGFGALLGDSVKSFFTSFRCFS